MKQEKLSVTLARIGVEKLEILDYGFRGKNLEVNFSLSGRILTTELTTEEIAGAAAESGAVESYEGDKVYLDDVRTCKADYWFTDLCEDKDILLADAIRFQAQHAFKSSVATKLPKQNEFVVMSWMQKLCVFYIWANRSVIVGGWWLDTVNLAHGKQTGAVHPECYRFARAMQAANSASRKRTLTDEDYNTLGRIFWLAEVKQATTVELEVTQTVAA